MDERLIFFFDDGTGERRAADPFRVKRLLALGLDGEPLHKVIEQSRALVAAIAEPAMERLLAAVCRAFGLAPLQPDGSGCTEQTVLRVLTDFVRWESEVKKKAASSATSLPPTGPTSSAEPSRPKSATPSG